MIEPILNGNTNFKDQILDTKIDVSAPIGMDSDFQT